MMIGNELGQFLSEFSRRSGVNMKILQVGQNGICNPKEITGDRSVSP